MTRGRLDRHGAARRPAGARPAGFTLVEVMIAIAITVSIGAMVAGSFWRLDRASEVARAQDERYGAARSALTRMAREISMAFLSDHFDPTQFRDRPTLFRGREDALEFTSMSHERLFQDAKESDQSLLEYTVGDDPDHPGTEALFRREKVHLDDEPDRGGTKDVLCDGVKSVRFDYWDRTRSEWVREWSTRSVEHANALPTRVRITLALAMPGGETQKFETEAPIAITKPLDF